MKSNQRNVAAKEKIIYFNSKIVDRDNFKIIKTLTKD